MCTLIITIQIGNIQHIHLQVAGEEECCIRGDFNMIDSLHDSSNNSIVLQGGERKQWEKCVHLNVCDIWHSANFPHKNDSLLFSQSNTGNSGSTLSRINHIYTGEALEIKGGWCCIALGMTFSDHFPVINHY